MMYSPNRPRQLSPTMHHCSHPRSNVPPCTTPRSGLVAGRRPEGVFAETTPCNVPRSKPVSDRRPERDLQRQVQQISNSHAQGVPSMSEDLSPERDQASTASTPSLSFFIAKHPAKRRETCRRSGGEIHPSSGPRGTGPQPEARQVGGGHNGLIPGVG